MWRTAKRLELQKRKGGEKEKEVSELARSPGSSKSESCGESWALGALSLLLCVPVPPSPSPGPLAFSCCCDVWGFFVWFFFLFCFPVPLLFCLFSCPAPSSSPPFSLSLIRVPPFLFLSAFLSCSLFLSPPPAPHLCSAASRCFFLFHLLVLICICLFPHLPISLACSLAFFSSLRLYVPLCVPAFLSLFFLLSVSIPLSCSLLLFIFVILDLAVPVLLPGHLLLSVTLCAASCPFSIHPPSLCRAPDTSLCKFPNPLCFSRSLSFSLSLIVIVLVCRAVLLPVPSFLAVSLCPAPCSYSYSSLS
ncbi:uncharacterized protein LOC142042815 [Buteo buteo]|uniref:uncharacterized protein LOC142042815 n=1 Tax=Buteo buteo TaxID=30397 RepID=UPI003EBBA86D